MSSSTRRRTTHPEPAAARDPRASASPAAPRADGRWPPAPPGTRWLDSKQLAAKVGLSWQTPHQWRMKGFGPPHVVVGRRVRYREDLVDAWLSEQPTGAARECPNPRARRAVG